MSVGLLRVLVQSQTISNQQAEHYNNLLQSGKEILPNLFSDGIISPKALGELVARVFSYPLLDLHYYPRNNVVSDILTEEQMVQNRCIPIFKRGRKVYFAVSDPTQIQNFQKNRFCFRFKCRLGRSSRRPAQLIAGMAGSTFDNHSERNQRRT